MCLNRISISDSCGYLPLDFPRTDGVHKSRRKRAKMKERFTIVQHSATQFKRLRAGGANKTSAKAPEAESLGAEFWSKARVVTLRGKTPVHLRLDSDVVEWFEVNGKGHLTRMNAVLKAYVDARK
jgi:uncharacterized protein (DUF4415 family)